MNEVLRGKGSFLWVLLLGRASENELEPLLKLYKGHIDNEYALPLCRSVEETKSFLELHDHYLKVITDMEHSEQIVA